MKLKLIIICSVFLVAFSACQKCVVCTPYLYTNGTLGSIDNNFTRGGTQSIKLCDKRDINSYENGTNFQDENRDTVRFICK